MKTEPVMKKILLPALAIAFVFICGCSKNNSNPNNTGGSGSDSSLYHMFNNKIWSGGMNVTYQPNEEPFSLGFSDDSVVSWWHASIEEFGIYKIDKSSKKITVSFPGQVSNGPSFSATIANDSSLTNIVMAGPQPFTNSAQVYQLNSCAINNTTTQLLDNTTWTGTWESKSLKMNFQPQLKVDVYIDGVFYTTGSYGYDVGYIRINTGADRFYGVLFGNTIKGLYVYSNTFVLYTVQKN
jgi:hypothetical protein